MADELSFDDLTPIEVPVSIAGRKYTLREATEGVACQYRSALMRGAKMEGKKVVALGDIASTEPLLVSLCLYDEAGKNVPLETVRAWPARVVKTLFDKAKEISHLDEGEETAETLQEQIAELKERLVEMEGGEDAVKN